MRRNNGFQRPLNPMQIGTWVLLPTLLLQFFIFASPLLPLAASILCTLAVVLCGGFTAFFSYKCCITDSIDSRLRRHLALEENQNGSNAYHQNDSSGRAIEEDDPTKFCWVCGIDVHVLSMHCKFCDKCVSHFDHHCHWLNTCVGKENYEFFFRAVIATLSLVAVRAVVLSSLVIAYFLQYTSQRNTSGEFSGNIVKSFDEWFHAGLGLLVAGINLFFIVVDGVCIVLIGQLVLFHIRLRREGITTYAYITRDGQRKREAAREKMERGRKRIVAVQNAKKKREVIRHWRLVAAGCPVAGEVICKPCDPLRSEEMKVNKQTQLSNLDEKRGNSDETVIKNMNDEIKVENDVLQDELIHPLTVEECDNGSCECRKSDSLNKNSELSDQHNDVLGDNVHFCSDERNNTQHRSSIIQNMVARREETYNGNQMEKTVTFLPAVSPLSTDDHV